MVDHALLYRELSRFATTLAADFDVSESLQDLASSTAQTLDLDGAGVTLWMPDAQMHYIMGTDPVTLAFEQRQDELREGPCIDALRSSEVCTVGDLTADGRWPQYTPVALEAGFCAVAGVPIRFHGRTVGPPEHVFVGKSGLDPGGHHGESDDR